MRKCSLLLIPLLLWGCEKTFDNVIDTFQDNYQVSAVAGIKDSIDLKNPADSLLNLRLVFTPESEVNNVYFNILDPDNSPVNLSTIEMNEVANNIFENRFILRREYPIGNYSINFSVTGFDGKNKNVAVGRFYFNNGQDNIAPVISNTVIEPDTAIVTDTTVVFTSVEVIDSNGQNDIAEVYFIVYKPDGSTNNIKIELFDDGDCCIIPPTEQSSGDLVAGDGIFSRKIQVDQNNEKGTYRFEFQAKDRSGALSNIINHFVLIQ